jgi:hypothetical protein
MTDDEIMRQLMEEAEFRAIVEPPGSPPGAAHHPLRPHPH